VRIATHKRGDSFSFTVLWTDDDTGRVFTGTTALAQLRNEADTILETLTTVVTPATGTVSVAVSATAAQTALWTLGTHRVDVQLTLGSDVWSTETFGLRVVYDVSRV
jgi:hypothetical protein